MADSNGLIKKLQIRSSSGRFTDTGSADRLSGAWAYRSMVRVDTKPVQPKRTTTYSSGNEKKK